MAYADQSSLSTRKVVAIGLVALLHALIGYAFITGLAFTVVKKVASDLKVIDVQEEPPPPEVPPPPPPEQPKVAPPPPMVSPPPIVRTTTLAPPMQTVRIAPPPVITPTAPVAPPAPPAPPAPVISKAAGAKGNPSSWVTNDDYPPSALRAEEQGRVSISYTINTAGRIENCAVTSSSGSSTLDDATCRLVTRRAKYAPAQDQSGNPIASRGSQSFKWVIPKD